MHTPPHIHTASQDRIQAGGPVALPTCLYRCTATSPKLAVGQLQATATSRREEGGICHVLTGGGDRHLRVHTRSTETWPGAAALVQLLWLWPAGPRAPEMIYWSSPPRSIGGWLQMQRGAPGTIVLRNKLIGLVKGLLLEARESTLS